MKLFILISYLLAGIIFFSCRSTYQDSAASTLRANDIESISCSKVSVSINQINNSQLAEELNQIADLKLSTVSNYNGKSKHFLELQISERSFFESFDNKYSLFIYAKVFDENNILKYKNGFYSVSPESIISSGKQFSEIKKVVEDINREILKANINE